MDAVRFFLGLHDATRAGSERWLGGLTDEQLRRRPGPGLNSIVWLLWHMARTEDVAVNLVVAARAQVLDAVWARRLRSPRTDMGAGMTAAEAADLSERADVAAVHDYRAAVAVRTREVVPALAPAARDEVLGLDDTTRAADTGAFGPNDEWIPGVGHRPWQDVTRGHQLGQTAIRHNAAHIGEAVTLRGLAGLGLNI